jgi:chaperone required for assembly of F1-ATPase
MTGSATQPKGRPYLSVTVAGDDPHFSVLLDGRPIRTPLKAPIDRVAPHRERIIAEIVQFTSSDLVCYRAEAPDALIAKQAQHWDPILAWAAEVLGAAFTVTRGVVHISQPEAGLEAVRRHLGQESEWSLTAIHNVTTLLGSGLLAIMVAGRAIEAEAAWRAAHVDEDWQIELWGADAEASARREARRGEFDTCVRFLDLSSS